MPEVTTSPYVYVPSKQKFDPLMPYPDFEYVLGLIAGGIISDFEIKMIRNTANYKFVTTSQLVRFSGMAQSTEKIRRKLSLMCRNRILMRFSIDQEIPTNKKIFALDRFGYNIITNYLGEKISWKPENNLKTMSDVFSTLEFNEIALKALNKKNVIKIHGLPEIKLSESRTYLPTGLVETTERTFLFEVIRRAPGWDSDMVEKIENIEGYISKSAADKPVITVVGEDSSHIFEIADVFERVGKRKDYHNELNIRFSFDEIIRTLDISKIFCSIKGGNIRHIKSKILEE